MNKLKKVFFGLVVAAMVGSFAEPAMAQFTRAAAAGPGIVFLSTSLPRQMRTEGLTETAGEVVLTVNAAGQILDGSSVDLLYSAAITNQGAASFLGTTLTCITGGAPVACPASIAVTRVGTSILRIAFANPGDAFGGTALAAGDQLIIALVRVNANSAGAGPVTATMSGTSASPATNPITFTEPIRTVGVIFTSLTATIPNGAAPSILTCAPPAQPAAPALPAANFLITAAEVFPAALATLAQETAFAPAAHPATAPTTGTTVIVTISGVPAGFRLVPVAAFQSSSAGVATLPAATTLGLSTVSTFPAPVTQASGASGSAITAIYVVDASSTAVVETFTMSFHLGTIAGAPVAAGGLTGPVTATVSIGPISTTGTVRMAANAIGPGTVANVSDCVTRLEMSWVVNVAGYDTGIAIANTTEDDAAFGTGAALGAVPQSGTCTLTGYPAAGGTPISFTTASIPAGQTLAFVISGATGFSGFSGYVLTVCNFLNAHAFAFITNGFGSSSGPNLAQGYQALVVPTLPATRVIPGGEALGH